jgi:hypothetical protein
MRKHGIPAKHAKEAIKMIHGAGFFDFIRKVGKKAIDFYGKHKDTIHKVGRQVIKHAPKAIEGYKKNGLRGAVEGTVESVMNDGYEGDQEEHEDGGRRRRIKRHSKKHSKKHGGSKKYSRKTRGSLIAKIMREKHCTLGEASRLLKNKGY